MNNTTRAVTEFCDVCKAETERCQYYPIGRSRQHGRCLECDRKDARNPTPYQNKDRRYCSECDRNRQLATPRDP